MATNDRLKDHWAEQQLFLGRVIAAAIFVVGLSLIVVVRLGQLQILDYEYFSAQSQGNRIRVQPLPPTRGLIFDRNGAVLAENLPSYQLELTPEQVPDDRRMRRWNRLARSRDSIDTEEDIAMRCKALIRQNIDALTAIPIRRRLTDAEVARTLRSSDRVSPASKSRRDWPGITRSIKPSPMRIGLRRRHQRRRYAEDRNAAITPARRKSARMRWNGNTREHLHGDVGHETRPRERARQNHAEPRENVASQAGPAI